MKLQLLLSTDVSRNLDWKEPKMENFVTFFGDVVMMTLLKWRHKWFFFIYKL